MVKNITKENKELIERNLKLEARNRKLLLLLQALHFLYTQSKVFNEESELAISCNGTIKELEEDL